MRFEVTGGNGRGAPLPELVMALRLAGGRNVRTAHVYGMCNQPRVATFTADDEAEARRVTRYACEILWPGDGSIMANLIAHPRNT